MSGSLPSLKDGISMAQMLNMVLIEHDRQVAEMRCELARVQGQTPDPNDVAIAQAGASAGFQRPNFVASLGGIPAGGPITPRGRRGVDSVPRPKKTKDSAAQTEERSLEAPTEHTPLAIMELDQSDIGPPAATSGDEEFDEELAEIDIHLAEQRAANGEDVDANGDPTDNSKASATARLIEMLWNPMEKMATALILLNTVCLVTQLQFSGYLTGAELGVVAPGPFSNNTLYTAFEWAETVFTVLFAVELIVRIKRIGKRVFWQNHHVEWISCLDCIVVIVSVLDQIAEAFDMNIVNLSFLRPLRFARLLQLPIVRSGDTFVKLRLLCATVIRSLPSLFWSIVLVWGVMLFSGIFLSQTLNSTMLDPALDYEFRALLYQRYGTVARSFYTLFELTFSGGWPQYARPLVEKVGGFWAVFFIVYITFVVFAMFRIISALFIKDTMAVASEDETYLIKQADRKRERFGRKLGAFFRKADTSGDGQLTLSELKDCCANRDFEAILGAMGFTPRQCLNLFPILDISGDGHVSAEEFVKGMTHIKEGITPEDIMSIKLMCGMILNELHTG
mmetsp:Transcript_144746/g.360907  ORF Transcript_144746/g.360907 Transcript_144746/m.360907 type:complete len:563 (+) Transcript_144746:207-1895(+)